MLPVPCPGFSFLPEFLEQDRFLILTHPEMQDYVIGKAQDPDRWIRGMTKLWARAQALLS